MPQLKDVTLFLPMQKSAMLLKMLSVIQISSPFRTFIPFGIQQRPFIFPSIGFPTAFPRIRFFAMSLSLMMKYCARSSAMGTFTA